MATVNAAGVIYEEDIVRSSAARKVLAGLRIVIGWYFLWAFVDKVFGLGYSTPAERAWINGGKPAQGFLGGTEGVFSGLFQAIGSLGSIVDILFMLSLVCIGVALLLGVGVKVTAVAASVLLGMMYLAQFPLGVPAGTYTNPLFDDHWIIALAIIFFALVRGGDEWGLGKWWASQVGDGWLR